MNNKQSDFDKQFNRAEKAIGCTFILNFLIVAGFLFFLAWVVIKFMQYFGII